MPLEKKLLIRYMDQTSFAYDVEDQSEFLKLYKELNKRFVPKMVMISNHTLINADQIHSVHYLAEGYAQLSQPEE